VSTGVTRPTMDVCAIGGRPVLCTPFSLAATNESNALQLVRAKSAAASKISLRWFH